jgi:hypothetical protein
MEIFHEFTFEAAHWLIHVSAGRKRARPHGHSYRVQIRPPGPVGLRTGWVVDLQDINDVFAPLHDQLDHRSAQRGSWTGQWNRCTCGICSRVGIQIVIFRRSVRNKRRSLHNIYVLRQCLDRQLVAGSAV